MRLSAVHITLILWAFLCSIQIAKFPLAVWSARAHFIEEHRQDKNFCRKVCSEPDLDRQFGQNAQQCRKCSRPDESAFKQALIQTIDSYWQNIGVFVREFISSFNGAVLVIVSAAVFVMLYFSLRSPLRYEADTYMSRQYLGGSAPLIRIEEVPSVQITNSPTLRQRNPIAGYLSDFTGD